MSPRLNSSLAFIELPSQISTALKYSARHDKAGAALMALTPHVDFALSQRGLSCLVPEDYHNEEDINDVGLQNIEALEGFTKYADDFLLERWELLAEEDLRPASLNWYYLKLFFNSVSIRAFIIQRVLAAEEPGRVLYFDSKQEPVGRDLFFGWESPWSRVIPLVCRELGIPCQTMPGNTDGSELWKLPGQRHGGIKPLLKVAGRQMLGPAGIRLVRKGVRTSGVVRSMFRRSDHGNHGAERPSVLVLDRGYSLGRVVQLAQERQEFNIYHWDGHQFVPPFAPNETISDIGEALRNGLPTASQLSAEATRLWQEISNQPDFNSFLSFSGVDCRPAMESRIKNFFETDIPQLVSSYFTGRALVRKIQPAAVVTSTLGDYWQKAFSVGVRREGVPLVVYRHGDSSAHLWGGGQKSSHWSREERGRSGMYIERNELPMSDYILVFGEGDVNFLEGISATDVKIVPVGSAILDQMKRDTTTGERDALHRKFGLDPAKRTVMYVPPAMEGGVRSAPYQLRSPGLMFDIQKRLLDTFKQYPDIQFVIKAREAMFHPCPPIVHQIHEKGPPNCVVITAPFPSVLGLADIFIVDVASTVFLEMLTTDRPILLCAHQLSKKFDPSEWSEDVRAMWNERVVYSTDMEEFIQTLRKYLDQDHVAAVESSNTLFKLFGTYKNDGASAERAHDFLLSLARR